LRLPPRHRPHAPAVPPAAARRGALGSKERSMKADLSKITPRRGSRPYPEPHNDRLAGRTSWTLTSAFGLRQFGVNRVELAPGAWSTQRHWHRKNDEAVIVVEGELVLVTDDGEEVLKAGDCVGFKAGVPN